MPKEYTVIGNWIIRNNDGHIRHRECRRWCDTYNLDNRNEFHMCGGERGDENWGDLDACGIKIVIPSFVILISTAVRKAI